MYSAYKKNTVYYLLFLSTFLNCSDDKKTTATTLENPPTALVSALKYYNSFAFNHVYTLNLNLGGQTIETVLDTGSSNLLAIGDSSHCSSCVNEYGYSSVYTPSSSSKKLSSTWSMSFLPIGQAQIQGYQDTLTFQDYTLDEFDFGMVTSEKGIPNIWGIAYPDIAQPSSDRQTPIFDALVSKFNLKNQFSLTLCATKKGSSGTFGGYDSNLTTADLNAVQWTPIVKKQWYSVPLTHMFILDAAGTSTEWLWSPASTDIVIVDSGTTPLVIPATQVTALVKVLKSYASRNGITLEDSFWPTSTDKGGLASLTDAQVAKFPTIKLEMTSFNDSSKVIALSISPQNYFQTTSTGARLLGVQPGNFYILGTVFMENYVTLHNRGTTGTGTDNTAKLGFFPNSAFCK